MKSKVKNLGCQARLIRNLEGRQHKLQIKFGSKLKNPVSTCLLTIAWTLVFLTYRTTSTFYDFFNYYSNWSDRRMLKKSLDKKMKKCFDRRPGGGGWAGGGTTTGDSFLCCGSHWTSLSIFSSSFFLVCISILFHVWTCVPASSIWTFIIQHEK